jgi:hypothetical protein
MISGCPIPGQEEQSLAHLVWHPLRRTVKAPLVWVVSQLDHHSEHCAGKDLTEPRCAVASSDATTTGWWRARYQSDHSASEGFPIELFYELFTNLLFENYEPGYPMVMAIQDDRERESAEIGMLLTSFITMVCTAGTAFYLRFLFALCKEYNSRVSRDRRPRPPRLRLEKLHVTPPPRKDFRHRAARQITEIPLYTHITWRRDSI